MTRLKPLSKVTRVVLMGKEIQEGIDRNKDHNTQREIVLYGVENFHYGPWSLELLA